MKRCPHCSSWRVSCRNRYRTHRQGWAQRFLCRACKRTWVVYERRFFGHNANPRTRLTQTDLLRAGALFVLGLPWYMIGQLLEIRGASLQKGLLQLLESETDRKKLERGIKYQFGFPAESGFPYLDVSGALDELIGIAQGLIDPREHGREYIKRVWESSRYRRCLERKLRRILHLTFQVQRNGSLHPI